MRIKFSRDFDFVAHRLLSTDEYEEGISRNIVDIHGDRVYVKTVCEKTKTLIFETDDRLILMDRSVTNYFEDPTIAVVSLRIEDKFVSLAYDYTFKEIIVTTPEVVRSLLSKDERNQYEAEVEVIIKRYTCAYLFVEISKDLLVKLFARSTGSATYTLMHSICAITASKRRCRVTETKGVITDIWQDGRTPKIDFNGPLLFAYTSNENTPVYMSTKGAFRRLNKITVDPCKTVNLFNAEPIDFSKLVRWKALKLVDRLVTDIPEAINKKDLFDLATVVNTLIVRYKGEDFLLMDRDGDLSDDSMIQCVTLETDITKLKSKRVLLLA